MYAKDISRGWYVSTESGEVQKNCANCEDFTSCEKNPRWKDRVCKDFKKLMTVEETREMENKKGESK